jgi:hypothetical protein
MDGSWLVSDERSCACCQQTVIVLWTLLVRIVGANLLTALLLDHVSGREER